MVPHTPVEFTGGAGPTLCRLEECRNLDDRRIPGCASPPVGPAEIARRRWGIDGARHADRQAFLSARNLSLLTVDLAVTAVLVFWYGVPAPLALAMSLVAGTLAWTLTGVLIARLPRA